MLRATTIVRRLAVKPDQIADRITLDHEGRNRRRIALEAQGGLRFLLDLDKAAGAKSGDAFKLEDGRLVEVDAAPERLLEVRAESPARLARIAWHIGNRHTPAEITADAIYIHADHVLAEMVRGLGGAVAEVNRPFEPERGAYAGGHSHAHGPHHDHHHHDHQHAHHHDHAHHRDGHPGHGDHGHGYGHDVRAHPHGHPTHDHELGEHDHAHHACDACQPTGGDKAHHHGDGVQAGISTHKARGGA